MSIPLQARSGAWQPALELLEPISLVRCCTSPLGRNLCMIVTETAVHVYATSDESPNLSFEPVTSFFLGCRATGASWSPSTQHASTAWRIEILVATETNELRLLESVRQGSEASTSNKKLADTYARVTDLAWCASPGYESYAAAACSDGTVRLWDLEGGCRTHYLNSAVLSVAFHPKVPKLLLAMESSGVGYLLDWLASDGEVRTAASFHEPITLGAHATQHYEAQGAAAWQAQDADMVGALLGTRWCVWNVHEASVPVASGQLHQPSVHGGLRFCPTNSRLFAVFAHGSMRPSISWTRPSLPVLGVSTSMPRRLFDRGPCRSTRRAWQVQLRRCQVPMGHRASIGCRVAWRPTTCFSSAWDDISFRFL